MSFLIFKIKELIILDDRTIPLSVLREYMPKLKDEDLKELGPVEYDQSKVPEVSKKHAENVRRKVYLPDMTESFARGVEYAGLVSSEAENKATNADLLSKDTQNRFKDQIEGTTNSDEVIDARRPFGAEATFQTLGERMDYVENDLQARSINVKFPPIPLVGLKGDNVTDDTQALKNIISYAVSIKLRHLIFPEGDYIISETITVNSHMTFVGVGKNLTFIHFKGDGKLFEVVDKGLFVNMKSMALRGPYNYTENLIPEGSVAISAAGPQHLRLQELDIRSFGDGLNVTRGSDVSAIGVVLEDCYIKQNLRYGAYLTGIHKLQIKNGAIEMNNEWNLFIGDEIMEGSIDGVNMNISNYSRNGSIKSESNTPILDALEITHCHFEDIATNKRQRNAYLLDFNSNNIVAHQNYIKSRDGQVLGGIKSATAQNVFEKNTFRNLEKGVYLTGHASDYVTYLKENIYEDVTTKVSDDGGLVRYQDLGLYSQMETQEFIFEASTAGTIAFKKPRFKNMLYTAKLYIVSSAKLTNQDAGQVIVSTTTGAGGAVYTSPSNFMYGKDVGTDLGNIAFPRNMSARDTIYVITRQNTQSPNAKLCLRLEWM